MNQSSDAMANADMLILARESRGMTQTDLARAVGISQPMISKFEGRSQPISDDQLEKLSTALNYPVSFFFQNAPVYGYGSSCLYHRKRQTLPPTEYRRLLARINVLRIQITKLLQGIELDSQNQFQRLDVTDYDSPEHIARLIRGMWHVPPGPIQNLTELIESAGGIVVRCSFGTGKLDAISQWLPTLPPLFFVNSEIPMDRCRFTLAHELGHVLMHVVPTQNLEAEADQFAAELLMPRKEIGSYLKPMSLAIAAKLKPYWKTAMSALIRRAFTLNKISPSQYRGLMTRMSRLGYRRVEPVQLAPEEPYVLSSILDVQLKTYGETVASLSRKVSSNEQEFLSQFLPKEQTPRFRVV